MSELTGSSEPPECLLEQYIEMLRSGNFGKTYIIDSQLDHDGNGNGWRNCGRCALHIVTKNGIPPGLTNETMVAICPKDIDVVQLPNIIC